jgi:hypothetical protein
VSLGGCQLVERQQLLAKYTASASKHTAACTRQCSPQGEVSVPDVLSIMASKRLSGACITRPSTM